MADTQIRDLETEIAPSSRAVDNPPRQGEAGIPMLQAATNSFGAAVVRRKVARRLARRAAGPLADSLATSSAGAGIASAAKAATGPAESASDLAEKGVSGAARELPYRREMEQSFGTDLAGVRAYTDSHATLANEALHSHAYAMGDQIAFKSAAPDRATVAHELTHVLQQTRSPSFKSEGEGIDTSGEAQADAVEAAVATGKPASSVLGSAAGGAVAAGRAVGRKVARKEDEGKFGMGLNFSKEGFEKYSRWELWKGKEIAFPTPIVGLSVKVAPEVVLKGKMGGDYAGENRGNLSLSLGIEGSVLVAPTGGRPNVAEVYGGIEGIVAGAGTFNSQTATDEHAGPRQSSTDREQPPHEGASAHRRPAHHRGHGSWALSAGLAVSGAIKVGIKLGPRGFFDNSIEFGKAEIFKLTGIYFDQAGFRSDKLGFEWGKDMKELFEAIQQAVEKVEHLSAEGWNVAKRDANKMYKGAREFHDSVLSWCDSFVLHP